MMARLAEALDHAERRGVTHGDVKPSNILITADGTPMLFDFNLAVDWHAADSLDPGADLGGTLAYMAPERLRALGGEPAGATPGDSSVNFSPRRQPDRHRADLYAIGLVLAEALTGEPPAVPARRSDDPRQFASGLAQFRVEALHQPARRLKGISAGAPGDPGPLPGPRPDRPLRPGGRTGRGPRPLALRSPPGPCPRAGPVRLGAPVPDAPLSDHRPGLD